MSDLLTSIPQALQVAVFVTTLSEALAPPATNIMPINPRISATSTEFFKKKHQCMVAKSLI